jgi:hypothetical protein
MAPHEHANELSGSMKSEEHLGKETDIIWEVGTLERN